MQSKLFVEQEKMARGVCKQKDSAKNNKIADGIMVANVNNSHAKVRTDLRSVKNKSTVSPCHSGIKHSVKSKVIVVGNAKKKRKAVN